MKSTYDVAELLVASWRIANERVRMPTSHGILDAALRQLVGEHADLPEWFSEQLTFADTRVGLRCLELPKILDCAQESCLTSEPNAAYVTTQVKVDEITCEGMLRDLDIEPDAARRWGQFLRERTDAIMREDQARPVVIEAA